ncbi:hypothetical protein MBLNU457_g0766t1 [Dothideomycetes sp. NU457]
MASGIKSEDGHYIKPDPADEVDSKMMDEDEYEDTGELRIAKTAEESGAWLAKVPKMLWEIWENVAEDQELVLGEVRVYNPKPGDPEGKQKLKIVLKDIPNHIEVPKKYDINMNKDNYNNTVVFSEKDQPGYKSNAWDRDRRVPQTREQRQAAYSGISKPNNSKKPYKSSIPKQTALEGFLKHEVTVTAVENEEYRRLMKARYQKAEKPKHTTTIQAAIDTRFHPGIAQRDRFTDFVNEKNKPVKGKKTQQDKAVRISENELLDALQQCFREYRYWSLRTLRQRLKQPEAYIRQNLEKIGELVKSGSRFAGNWKLTDVYEKTVRGGLSVKEEAAEEGLSEDDGEDEGDGDEEGDDFEDVKME